MYTNITIMNALNKIGETTDSFNYNVTPKYLKTKKL